MANGRERREVPGDQRQPVSLLVRWICLRVQAPGRA